MYKLIKWIVIKWKQLWRTIWFKTANIRVENEEIETWTYKINWLIKWKVYSWVWTFIKESFLFEAHFFDFDLDIYWEEIEVMILYKIRDNKKFKDLEELKNQIKKDVDFVKKTNDYVLTFWTFDIVHPWHEYYLKNAKLYWDKLITIIATDKNVYKFKSKLPKNSEKVRLENIQNLKISNIVLIWSWNNPMKWLDKYKPKIICLWYDQMWFSDKLNNHIRENNLDIKIFRINSFREDIYKSSKLK